MAERMDFCDGKYTVINDNGKLTALRHGEIWGRDLVGDNLVYWMFVKARDLQEQNCRMLAALECFVAACEGVNSECSDLHEATAMAKAAIAEATGRKE